MKLSHARLALSTLGLVACIFDGELLDLSGSGSTVGASSSDATSSSASGTGGGGTVCGLTTCPPTGNPCEVATCVEDTCVYVPAPNGAVVSDGMAGNCKAIRCEAGIGSTVADPTDVVPDGNPCTIEQCSGQERKDILVNEGVVPAPELGNACHGVCQGGDYGGTCGYRISRRQMVGATPQGSWTTGAMTSAWSGTNAPPPTDILAAEETTNGARVMVFRNPPNGTPTYYERFNGTWKAPEPTTTTWANATTPVLDPTTIGSIATARSANVDFEIALIATSSPVDCPGSFRIYSYVVPDNGAITFDGSICFENRNVANSPDWQTFPIQWQAVHPTSLNDPFLVSFLGLNGQAYEELSHPAAASTWAPVADAASSPLGFTLPDAPDYGSIVAATIHKVDATKREIWFVSN